MPVDDATLHLNITVDGLGNVKSGMAEASTQVETLIRHTEQATRDASEAAHQLGQDAPEAFRLTHEQVYEARHAAQLLGEEIGVHIPRALATVVSSSETIGPLMAQAFSAVALIGFVDIAVKVVEKVSEVTDEVAGLTAEVKKQETEVEAYSRKMQVTVRTLEEGRSRLKALNDTAGQGSSVFAEFTKRQEESQRTLSLWDATGPISGIHHLIEAHDNLKAASKSVDDQIRQSGEMRTEVITKITEKTSETMQRGIERDIRLTEEGSKKRAEILKHALDSTRGADLEYAKFREHLEDQLAANEEAMHRKGIEAAKHAASEKKKIETEFIHAQIKEKELLEKEEEAQSKLRSETARQGLEGLIHENEEIIRVNKERLKVSDITLQGEIEHQNALLEAEKERLAIEVQDGLITEHQKINILNDFERHSVANIKLIMEAQRAAYLQGTIEYAQYTNKIKALDDKLKIELLKNEREEDKSRKTGLVQMEKDFASTGTRILMGQETFTQGMMSLEQQLAQSIIQNTLESLLVHEEAGKKSIFMSAKTAAAKAWESAPNPIIGAIEAAATFVGVMAYGSFDKGGEIPEDMMGMLHKNEMVLPSDIADLVRGMARGSGGSAPAFAGAGVNLTYAPVVKAFDPHDAAKVIKREGREAGRVAQKSVMNHLRRTV